MPKSDVITQYPHHFHLRLFNHCPHYPSVSHLEETHESEFPHPHQRHALFQLTHQQHVTHLKQDPFIAEVVSLMMQPQEDWLDCYFENNVFIEELRHARRDCTKLPNESKYHVKGLGLIFNVIYRDLRSYFYHYCGIPFLLAYAVTENGRTNNLTDTYTRIYADLLRHPFMTYHLAKTLGSTLLWGLDQRQMLKDIRTILELCQKHFSVDVAKRHLNCHFEFKEKPDYHPGAAIQAAIDWLKEVDARHHIESALSP